LIAGTSAHVATVTELLKGHWPTLTASNAIDFSLF